MRGRTSILHLTSKCFRFASFFSSRSRSFNILPQQIALQIHHVATSTFSSLGKPWFTCSTKGLLECTILQLGFSNLKVWHSSPLFRGSSKGPQYKVPMSKIINTFRRSGYSTPHPRLQLLPAVPTLPCATKSEGTATDASGHTTVYNHFHNYYFPPPERIARHLSEISKTLQPNQPSYMAISISKQEAAHSPLLPCRRANVQTPQPFEIAATPSHPGRSAQKVYDLAEVSSGVQNITKKRKRVQIGARVQVVTFDAAIPISDTEAPIHVSTRATTFESHGYMERTSCRCSTEKKSVRLSQYVRELAVDYALPPSNIRRCQETWAKAKKPETSNVLKRRLRCLDEAGTAEFAEFFNEYFMRRYCHNEKQEVEDYSNAWRNFLLDQDQASLCVLWDADFEYDSDWEDEDD